MEAIADEVSKGDYDLYLFQELWLENDYKTIEKSMPNQYQITDFLDFSVPSPKCGLQYCLPLCKSKKYDNMRDFYNSYFCNNSVK